MGHRPLIYKSSLSQKRILWPYIRQVESKISLKKIINKTSLSLPLSSYIHVCIQTPNQSRNQSNCFTLMVLLLARVGVQFPANPLFTLQPTFSHYSQCFAVGSLLPGGYGAQGG